MAGASRGSSGSASPVATDLLEERGPLKSRPGSSRWPSGRRGDAFLPHRWPRCRCRSRSSWCRRSRVDQIGASVRSVAARSSPDVVGPLETVLSLHVTQTNPSRVEPDLVAHAQRYDPDPKLYTVLVSALDSRLSTHRPAPRGAGRPMPRPTPATPGRTAASGTAGRARRVPSPEGETGSPSPRRRGARLQHHAGSQRPAPRSRCDVTPPGVISSVKVPPAPAPASRPRARKGSADQGGRHLRPGPGRRRPGPPVRLAAARSASPQRVR